MPPCTFDYVRTELIYVPRTRRRHLVTHLLASVVAPHGRLIVVSYGSSRPEGPRAEALVDEFRDGPFDIVRVDDTRSEAHGFVITRAVTLVAKEAAQQAVAGRRPHLVVTCNVLTSRPWWTTTGSLVAT